jgi:hypothetical protein
MGTSAWRPLAVDRGGVSTPGGGTGGGRRGREGRREPPQGGAMRCRSDAPKEKRRAVGQKETMRCRSAITRAMGAWWVVERELARFGPTTRMALA